MLSIGAGAQDARTESVPEVTAPPSLEVEFLSGGARVSGEGWELTLGLASFGRASGSSACGQVEPVVEGIRTVYRHGPVREWFTYRPGVLQQGFDVVLSPAGDGPLELGLALPIGWRAESGVSVHPGARDGRPRHVSLCRDGLDQRVHYVGLTAWDAAGRRLPCWLATGEGWLRIRVDDAEAVYPLTVDPWVGTELSLLLGATQESLDVFGSSVAIAGAVLACGEPGEASGGAEDVGVVRVFEQASPGGNWMAVQELSPSDASDRSFGSSLALEGNLLAVGADQFEDLLPAATEPGAVYLYQRDASGSWAELARLQASDGTAYDRFGANLAFPPGLLAVGAPGADPSTGPGEGRVYLFEPAGGGAWVETAVLVGSNLAAGDGYAASVSATHDTVAVGAPGREREDEVDVGAAFVFERQNGGWAQVAEVSSSDGLAYDQFGYAVAVSGGRLVCGAHMDHNQFGAHAGAAYAFERDQGGPGAWGQVQKLTASDAEEETWFAYALALRGDVLLCGSPRWDAPGALYAGAAYVFHHADGPTAGWREVAQLKGTGGTQAVMGSALAFDGGLVLAGAPGEGFGPAAKGVSGLAFDPVSGILYGSDTTAGRLLTIDPGTGKAVPVGQLGYGNIRGLAFDPATGTLFGLATGANVLVRIDVQTGTATAIGPVGFKGGEALAWDPTQGRLFATKSGSGGVLKLMALDPLDGSSTQIGTVGYDEVHGLAFEASSSTLFGHDAATGQLLAIDRFSGVGVPVGSPTVAGLASLAWSSSKGLVATLPDGGFTPGPDDLFTVDSSSGQLGFLAEVSVPVSTGAAHLFQLSYVDGAYCTAGVSASGCQALLSAAGTASATATSGFVLQAEGLEGGRNGLFFFGTGGQQAAPWGNGSSYQCVVPPLVRTPLQAGAGTLGACDGALSIDLNGVWCPTCAAAAKNPGPGVLVQAQLWYRDPFGTSNQTTSLSNAYELLVGP